MNSKVIEILSTKHLAEIKIVQSYLQRNCLNIKKLTDSISIHI